MKFDSQKLTICLCSLLLISVGCERSTKPTSNNKKNDVPDLPSFATVVVDFSKSFAPLTQGDRLALRETARALENLTVQEWTPPTTIVWRKIGTTSTAMTPICKVLEYKQSIVGAFSAAEHLRSALEDCTETIVRRSRVPSEQEAFTDIAGGVMMAAENWAPINGHKVVVILSDFAEDLPKGSRPVPLQLHGETVLLLHRPGTTEPDDPAAYLGRITSWKERFVKSGAQYAAALPVFRATLYDIREALSGESGGGTAVTLVADLLPSPQNREHLSHAVATLSRALAKGTSEWPPPINAAWFAAGKPAWRTTAVAPVVYTPSLVKRPNQLNSPDAFRIGIEETGIALQKGQHGGSGDIDGTLRLISDGQRASARYLVLLSDFTTTPPNVADSPLRGEQVIMIYSSASATDGALFFERIHKWQRYFENAHSARVCTLDIATLTESAIDSCMQKQK
jgi:hypothetical protein